MEKRMSRFSKSLCAAAAACGLIVTLAGCSDIYYDRRETVSAGANDAVAGNSAIQMIDPWPRSAANRDFASNGERVVLGIERYRTGRVIPPRGTNTSSAGYEQQQQQAPAPAPASSGASSVK
jgi:hypothetical protein